MGKDSKKHSKDNDREEKSKKDHKHKSKHLDKDKHHRSSGERREVSTPITEEDFFNKSEEFRVWLKLSKGQYFEDLSSKDARKIFEKDFVKDYNKGKLSSMYYEGKIPLEIRTTAVKSQHRWGFKLSKTEETQLADLTEDVDVQTRAPTNADKLGSSGSAAYCRPTTAPSAASAPVPAPVRGPASGPPGAVDRRLQADNDWDKRRQERDQQRVQQKVTTSKIAEEVLPGRETSGSHEQRRDQKRAAGDALHGAHRDKEEGRDGLAISESTLMGGDSRDDYGRLLDRERQYKDRRVEKTSERARELQVKAEEREMAFMQKLGIDPSKGRITIAPREN